MANSSTITGTPVGTAVATDPDLCRVSGYIKNVKGQPLAGQSFVLRYCYVPIGLGGDTLLLQERIPVKADKDGYVEFDLIRGAELTLELPNLLSDVFKELKVPDAASVDLMDFLFPYVETVKFADTTALSIAVDERFSVKVVGVLSNGDEVDLTTSNYTLSTSAPGVVDFHAGLGNYFIGVSPGAADITIIEANDDGLALNQTRDLEDLVFFGRPDPVIDPTPISVTVS
jgi:hypothetical protein